LQNKFLSNFGILVLFSHGNEVFIWHPSIQPNTFGNELNPLKELNFSIFSNAATPVGHTIISLAISFIDNKQFV